MSGEVYVVVEILKIHDQDGYADYAKAARSQLMERGATVVARGGRAYEGSPAFGGVMIQKWPSEAAFVEWQESDEYSPFKQIRLKSIDLRMAILPAV